MGAVRYVVIIKQYGATKRTLFDNYEDALEYYDYCQEERMVCTLRAVEHIDVKDGVQMTTYKFVLEFFKNGTTQAEFFLNEDMARKKFAQLVNDGTPCTLHKLQPLDCFTNIF